MTSPFQRLRESEYNFGLEKRRLLVNCIVIPTAPGIRMLKNVN